ncbi:Zinc finger protein [Plecturocebus cupreus]
MTLGPVRWLTLVIPALWEAKAGRSPEVLEFKTSLANMVKPISTQNTKLAGRDHTLILMYLEPQNSLSRGQTDQEGTQPSLDRAISFIPRMRLHLKKKEKKMCMIGPYARPTESGTLVRGPSNLYRNTHPTPRGFPCRLLGSLRQENGLNPGGRDCSEPRSCHCTSAQRQRVSNPRLQTSASPGLARIPVTQWEVSGRLECSGMISACCNLCLLDSSHCPPSASLVVVITGKHHHAQLVFIFLVETEFHHFDQADLELLTS